MESNKLLKHPTTCVPENRLIRLSLLSIAYICLSKKEIKVTCQMVQLLQKTCVRPPCVYPTCNIQYTDFSYHHRMFGTPIAFQEYTHRTRYRHNHVVFLKHTFKHIFVFFTCMCY